MRIRAYPIQIWFLDENLVSSAQSLTNKYLNSTIDGCFYALISARLNSIGIRIPNFYKFYFDKTRISETMQTYFPKWPGIYAPPYKKFDSKESKWTRQCKNHYDYVFQYMQICLEEYAIRYKANHKYQDFAIWEQTDAPQINLKYANLKSIVLPWKNLNPKYREKNIIDGYRKQYKSIIGHPLDAYADTPRDVPSWLMSDYMLEIQ